MAATGSFVSRWVDSVVTSVRLTIASLKLVFAHRTVLLLPVCTLLAVSLLVVAPLSLVVWGLEHHPRATADVFETIYFITAAAARAGNWNLAITAGIVQTYILWSLWMIPVLTAVFYFSAVGMDVAMQQIRGQRPSLGAGFGVANRNFWRIVALAAFSATIYAWVRYLVFQVLRAIPFVGTWVMRGLRLVLSAVSYLMLPIVVYERAGARQAFRSAWDQVKKTWSGLLIGSGLTFGATFLLFECFAWGLARSTLGNATVGILSLIAAAVLYAIANATAAALRAVLYSYATTGEVPDGFEADRLPDVSEYKSFTEPDPQPAR